MMPHGIYGCLYSACTCTCVGCTCVGAAGFAVGGPRCNSSRIHWCRLLGVTNLPWAVD